MKTNEWLIIVAVAIAGFFIGAICVSLLGWWGLPVAVAMSYLFGQMCVMIGRR